jgi:hypothetical protein
MKRMSIAVVLVPSNVLQAKSARSTQIARATFAPALFARRLALTLKRTKMKRM